MDWWILVRDDFRKSTIRCEISEHYMRALEPFNDCSSFCILFAREKEMSK